jgi:hypothetical protein
METRDLGLNLFQDLAQGVIERENLRLTRRK